MFCNGTETCHNGVCTAGTPPCPPALCDEASDTCTDCADAAQCDDGVFCNGGETCSNGACGPGSDPCPGQSCDERGGRCVECLEDGDCDDGLFCTGTESCVANACVAGTPPCEPSRCLESTNDCTCNTQGDCDDGVFCNGAEVCDSGICGAGSDPCPTLLCDEDLASCVECLGAGSCVGGPPCTENNVCVDGVCGGGTRAPIDCTPFEDACDWPGLPNSGETEILDGVQSTIYLCVPPPGSSEVNEKSMSVTHRIVTHDTPRDRDLHGMLTVSSVAGDASVVDLLYVDGPYTLGGPIPVIEPGHAGCDRHDWHFGDETFTLVPRALGEVTLKASVDPEPECCEGDGIPSVEAETTIKVLSFDLEIYNGGSDLDNGDELGLQGLPVPHDDEERVGAFVLVNWDDDDGDGIMNADGSWTSDPIPDLYEAPVQNEDNLAKLVPTVDPLPDEGSIELRVALGGSKIKLWTTSTKQTEIDLTGSTKRWDLGDPVQRSDFQQVSTNGLWIEGVETSDALQATVIRLYLEDAQGRVLFRDTVRLTVVMINLANAVYREGQIAGISGRGHSALVWKFVGPLTRENIDDDEKFRIIHMQGGGVVDNHNLTVMTQSPGEDAWGCFTNPAITYIDRLKILQAAKSLAARVPGIGYTGVNAVLGNNNLLEPGDWDGKLNTIANLRCDGLIEVCYETNDVDVWGMARTPDSGVVHYDITEYTDEWEYHPVGGGWDHQPNGLPDNLEEHNDFDSLPGDWKDTLQPATQSGHEPPVDADTKFQQQDLCIPVGSKGGN